MKESGVLFAKFSPDGLRIVTAGKDKKLRMWDARTGKILSEWPARAIGQGLCFSPDGKRLVAPMADIGIFGFDVPMAGIWDAENGRQLLRLQGHTDVIGPPLFSPDRDGRRIFTVSMDFTGRLWEAFPWHERDYPGPAGPLSNERIKLYARNYWRERLAAERSPSNQRDQSEDQSSGPAQPVNPFDWPARDRATPPELIDLTPHYNGALDTTHVPTGGIDLDNDLEHLLHGITTLENVRFDVRGIVTVRMLDFVDDPSQGIWSRYPIRANGIRIERKFRRLHALHAVCGSQYCLPSRIKDGTPIGSYVWHYADGSQREFEIVYGRDLRDWWKRPTEPNSETDRAKVVWEGTNPWLQEKEPGTTLRLYLSTYENPQPDLEVTSIDFVSKMTQAAPFLVAMTVEP